MSESGNTKTFLQIGAFDGVTGDLLYPFLKNNKWKGILVGNLFQIYFEELNLLHKNDQNIICVNCAISNCNGKVKFFTVDPSFNDPVFTKQLSSFNKEIILKHTEKISDLSKKIKEIEVEGITIESLKEKYRLEEINFLFIDAEGYDYEILKQVFNLNLLPELIVFENKHLGWEKFYSVIDWGLKQDYFLGNQGQNTFLIKKGSVEIYCKQNLARNQNRLQDKIIKIVRKKLLNK